MFVFNLQAERLQCWYIFIRTLKMVRFYFFSKQHILLCISLRTATIKIIKYIYNKTFKHWEYLNYIFKIQYCMSKSLIITWKISAVWLKETPAAQVDHKLKKIKKVIIYFKTYFSCQVILGWVEFMCKKSAVWLKETWSAQVDHKLCFHFKVYSTLGWVIFLCEKSAVWWKESNLGTKYI